MHQVQVEVLQPEVLQGVFDGQLDVLRVVVQFKELGGDPKLLSGDTRGLDTLADFGLVAIGPGAAVSGSANLGEGDGDGEGDLIDDVIDRLKMAEGEEASHGGQEGENERQ